MRWPFVSRREHERQCQSAVGAAVASANAEGARQADSYSRILGGLHTQILDERRRYDDLLAKYHALKLAGAVAVEPPPAPIIAAPVPVDIVREAIRKQVRATPGMPGLGGYLTDYARELRDERNMSPGQIVDALSRWESSEEQSAAVDSLVPESAEQLAEAI
jgi:hypothetical protein